MSKKDKVPKIKSHGIKQDNPEPGTTKDGALELQGREYLGAIGGAQAFTPRSIKFSEIREWIDQAAREAVHQAIQEELNAVKERFHAVSPPAQPTGENVSDQGPSVAPDQDEGIVPIRITIEAVTFKAYSLPYVGERLLDSLQKDYYNVFPYLEVVKSVEVTCD